MGRNIKGGKKHKRNKNNKKLELKCISCDNYFNATIKSLLGGNQIKVLIDDLGIETTAIIPGRLYKKVWFNINNKCTVFYSEKDKSCELVSKSTHLNKNNNAHFSILNNNNSDDVFSNNDSDDEHMLSNITEQLQTIYSNSINNNIEHLQTINSNDTNNDINFDDI